MKKVKLSVFLPLFTMVLFLGTASVACALNVYLDAGQYLYLGTSFDGNTLTDPWDEVSLRADTMTTQYDTDGNPGLTVGDEFSDSGHAKWLSYNFLPGFAGDSEGLDQAGGYDVTIVWNNLQGYISQIDDPGPASVNQNTIYTSGSFNFYFDPTQDANFGLTTNPNDDIGFLGADDYLFMTIELAYGTGTNTFDLSQNFLQGSSQIWGVVTYLDTGFLFEYPTDTDLGSYVTLSWLIGNLDQNTQATGLIQTNTGQENELFTVYSRHDGSMRLDVIPEPTTMLLLGTGLIGLAGLGRRKFFKKG